MGHRNNTEYNIGLLAASGGHVNVLAFLHHHGFKQALAARTPQGESCLLAAACNGQIAVMLLAPCPRSPLNSTRSCVFFLSISRRPAGVKAMEWLLKNGASMDDVNQTGDSLLMCASWAGRLETCRWLVRSRGGGRNKKKEQ